MTRGGFSPNETESIYVDERDRFVVSLIVGYSDNDLEDEEFQPGDELLMEYEELHSDDQARVAARAALALTRDEGSSDTKWFVYDRESDTTFEFEQGEFEGNDER